MTPACQAALDTAAEALDALRRSLRLEGRQASMLRVHVGPRREGAKRLQWEASGPGGARPVLVVRRDGSPTAKTALGRSDALTHATTAVRRLLALDPSLQWMMAGRPGAIAAHGGPARRYEVVPVGSGVVTYLPRERLWARPARVIGRTLEDGRAAFLWASPRRVRRFSAHQRAELARAAASLSRRLLVPLEEIDLLDAYAARRVGACVVVERSAADGTAEPVLLASL